MSIPFCARQGQELLLSSDSHIVLEQRRALLLLLFWKVQMLSILLVF